ncbi:MAG: DUF2384 domain-containing protein [Salinicola sp.]|uniref:DUF2384 domain-containing protein n=1 Tax=Salinicola sp. TaxID=1978524 RepID=UPI000C907CCB|nr:DUF2384 domain-containing protein [Salinicola sp.]MAM58918.1 DUF2384 domain-containing protein [Salinicola sp.]NRB56769.1 DUF2384 domain-containing protein [Salinicola sp.]|tara:strand:- start:16 stop:444 length:429 start_codon:yes stop_codon:yes gene_type:complete
MATEALRQPIEPSNYRAPDSFDRFVQDLRAAARPGGHPIINPRLFASALSMDIQVLASRAHVHRTTINRAEGAEKLQSFLRDAIRVLAAATDINGSFHDALFWFRNEPISTFDYQTAEQLVSDGRSEDLLRYIRALQAGVVG